MLAAFGAALLFTLAVSSTAGAAPSPSPKPDSPMCSPWQLNLTVHGPCPNGKVVDGKSHAYQGWTPGGMLEDQTVGPMAKGLATFTTDILKNGLTWWLTTPSVQISTSGVTGHKPDPAEVAGHDTIDAVTGQHTPLIDNSITLQSICLGLGVMIATLLTMVQAIKTAIQRKPTPLIEAATGLLINVFVCAAGIAVIDGLLVASDKLTTSILDATFQTTNPARIIDTMVAVLIPTTLTNPAGLLALAALVLFIGIVQMVLLFLRQAAIPIQGILLPIAGAGQVGGNNTRQWLPRLLTAIMMIITYKPAAALIIGVGFMELQNGQSPVDWIRGIVTMTLSVVALKGLMSIFQPLGVKLAGGMGSGMGGLMSMAGGLVNLGASSGGSGAATSAASHAQHMERYGPAGPPNAQPTSQTVPQQSTKKDDSTDGNTAVSLSKNADTKGTPPNTAAEANPAATGPQPGTPTGPTTPAPVPNGKPAVGGPMTVTVVGAEAVNNARKGAADTMTEGSKQA